MTSPAKSLVADNPGLCDVYESIDGGNFDWANPEATAAARVGEGRRRRTAASSSSSSLSARLGGGASGCETDVGGFDGATLDQCRDACKRAAGCESFHSFHVTATDGSFATDDYSCRLCGPGGEGAFVPPPGNVETARGPAWCLTKHNLTMRVESLEECANACDATEGCDAFNHGAFDGDCLLLELGASAKRGMLWRASGMSPTGVVGYATYYAMTGAEVNAALRDETGELMAPGAGGLELRRQPHDARAAREPRAAQKSRSPAGVGRRRREAARGELEEGRLVPVRRQGHRREGPRGRGRGD